MAVKNGTLKRKNAGGTYDVIDLKTSGEQVILNNGKSIQEIVDGGGLGGTTGAVVTADIPGRDALTPTSGQIVYVVDATGDSTVTSGAASYIYDGVNWQKVSEFESLDVVLNWANIQGKPNVIDVQVSASEPSGQKEGDIWIEETV